MISILTTAANAILGLAITALKAFLSMLTWFLKLFFGLLKYLYCVLPVTAVVFCGLYCLNTFLLLSGSAGPDKISTDALSNERIEQTAQDFLKIGNSEVVYFYNELVTWWKDEIGKYKGTFSFVILLVLSFVLLAPVVGVILGITVLFSYGKILLFAVAADMAFYVGFAVLGKGFMSVMQNRYYRLFPDAGKRHFAREYAQWKKERNAEAAENANNRREQEGRSFYDDSADRYPDDDCIIRRRRHEYYDERTRYDRGYDERYDDSRYDDAGYEDSRYDEPYDDAYGDADYADDYSGNEYYEEEYPEEDYYEDEYYEEEEEDESYGYEREPAVAAAGSQTFDFFAGCKSRESAERKYKSLVKLYHPDNMDGDNGALQEINVQYDKVKKHFS